MRPFPLTVQKGGINRLRVKGAARADMLYDLLNGYVTNAGSITGREGTRRFSTLSSSTAGLMEMNGQFHVFSAQPTAVPAGFVDDVLVDAAAPFIQFTPTPPIINPVYTVPSLLHFEDGNGSVAFTDSGQSPETWSAIGNAQESTAQAVSGRSSLQFTNGNAQNCAQAAMYQTALDIFTGQPDFTVELWIYVGSLASGNVYRYLSYGWFNGNGSGSTTGVGFSFYQNGNQITVEGDMTAGHTFGNGTPTVINQLSAGWNHVAFVRAGNLFRLFVNGQNRTLSATSTSDVLLGGNFVVPAAGAVVQLGCPSNPGSVPQVNYIDEFRVTNGRALYGGEFAPPGGVSSLVPPSQIQFSLPLTITPTFPYEVTNLLHFEDGNGSTTFTDASGATWTAHGAAQETTTQAKLGTGSGEFLNSGDYIATTVNQGAFSDYTVTNDDCDFTIEMFVYPPQSEINDGLTHYFFDPGSADGGLGAVPNTMFAAYFQGTALKFLGQGSFGTITYAGAFPVGNTWYHVAFVRRGDVITTFVNGISQGSANNFAFMSGLNQFSGNTGTWYIGASARVAQSSGYIDEFRAIHGLACYVSNFMPPTAPYQIPSSIVNSIVKIWFAKPFMGFPYVVAQFLNGDILNYWLQNNGSWAPTTVYFNGNIVTPDNLNGYAYQAVRDTIVNPTWAAGITVTAGQMVEPSEYTGFAYRAVAVATNPGASAFTGSAEPTWPTSIGGTIQEFGNFNITQSTAATNQDTASSSTTVLGTSITDRYGDSSIVAGQTGIPSTLTTLPTAAAQVTAWQPGTIYAPGAVVRPGNNQGAFINAIPNGDFESGNIDWTLSDGDVTIINNAALAYQGSWCLQFALTNDTDTATMTNYGTVQPGQSVTASAYLNPNNNGPNMSMWVNLLWYTSGGIFISRTQSPTAQGVGYRNVSVTGVAPATAARVFVQIESSTGTHSINGSYADLVTWSLEEPAAISNFLYEAVQSQAGTSGVSQPAWPTIAGNTVVDGGVTWEAIGTSIITWQAIPLMLSGTNQPAFPTSVGVTVADGSTYTSLDGHVNNTGMSWVLVSREVTDPNCPNNPAAALGASHVFEGNNDICSYSAAVNPIDWSSTNNAGYLPTGLNNYGDNPIKVLSLYRGNLVIFNAGGYQMWQIDPDPENMALLDAQPVGSIYTQAAQSVANDLLFLAEVGVRNLGTIGATANMQIGNTGQPIDPLVLAQIQAGTYYPNSLYYPARGQYWLIFGPQAFVLTINGSGIRSWSRYVFPDTITDWALNAGVLYLRTAGNLVWKLDATALQDDVGGTPVSFKGVLQWPYLDMGSLGGNKQLIGLDLVGDGAVTVQIAYREDDPTTFSDNPGFSSSLNVTAPYLISAADTVPGTPIPIPVDAPSYSLILTFSGNQSWDWEAANFYFQDNRGRGF